MSYTPGPWEFDGEGYIFAKPMGEGRMIAQVRGWGWLQKKGEDAGVAEQEANGFLLAAAPELLDACKLAAKQAFRDDEGRAAVYACRAAIAVAEGPKEGA